MAAYVQCACCRASVCAVHNAHRVCAVQIVYLQLRKCMCSAHRVLAVERMCSAHRVLAVERMCSANRVLAVERMWY